MYKHGWHKENTKAHYHMQRNEFCWQLSEQNVKNVKDAFVAHGTFERKFKFACEIVSQNSLSMWMSKEYHHLSRIKPY